MELRYQAQKSTSSIYDSEGILDEFHNEINKSCVCFSVMIVAIKVSRQIMIKYAWLEMWK